MARNNRELQAELEAANKRIAELSQSNQNANSNIVVSLHEYTGLLKKQ